MGCFVCAKRNDCKEVETTGLSFRLESQLVWPCTHVSLWRWTTRTLCSPRTDHASTCSSCWPGKDSPASPTQGQEKAGARRRLKAAALFRLSYQPLRLHTLRDTYPGTFHNAPPWPRRLMRRGTGFQNRRNRFSRRRPASPGRPLRLGSLRSSVCPPSCSARDVSARPSERPSRVGACEEGDERGERGEEWRNRKGESGGISGDI